MNSIKSKSNEYTLIGNRAVGGVVFLPVGDGFRVYVAWEWEGMAAKGIFAVCRSTYLIKHIHADFIEQVADYGTDVTHKPEIRALFPKLWGD